VFLPPLSFALAISWAGALLGAELLPSFHRYEIGVTADRTAAVFCTICNRCLKMNDGGLEGRKCWRGRKASLKATWVWLFSARKSLAHYLVVLKILAEQK
jgi:hypothetical protein